MELRDGADTLLAHNIDKRPCASEGPRVRIMEPDRQSRRRPVRSIQPPDGKWGWMVVLGSFLTFVVVDGISYSFGILYVELLDYFDATKSETSWIGSLVVGWAYVVGPVASIIVDRYGCRVTAIIGSVMAAFGFLLSAVIYVNIYFLYFTFGTIGGIGIGLVYLPAVVCVGQYFDKYRALATGIALCGTGVGTFSMAPVMQWLVKEYGWKGTMILISAIMLNCAAFGALFRPLTATRACFPCCVSDDTNAGDDEEFKELEKGQSLLSTDDGEEECQENNINLRTSKPLYQLSQLSLNKNPPIEYRPIPASQLFCSVPFLLFCLSNFLTHLGYCAPYLFLPHQAEIVGIKKPEAALLISVIGLTNMIGRVLFGWLGDKIGDRRLYLYSSSAVINGVAAALMPALDDYVALIISSAVFGLSASSLFGLTSVVLVDLLGLENLVLSFGVLIVGRGLATIIGAPMLGWVFDRTGNYHYSFIFAGVSIVLSGAILYPISCLKSMNVTRPTKEEKNET